MTEMVKQENNGYTDFWNGDGQKITWMRVERYQLKVKDVISTQEWKRAILDTSPDRGPKVSAGKIPGLSRKVKDARQGWEFLRKILKEGIAFNNPWPYKISCFRTFAGDIQFHNCESRAVLDFPFEAEWNIFAFVNFFPLQNI